MSVRLAKRRRRRPTMQDRVADIVAALVGAQSRVVRALELNVDGDEDRDGDYDLVKVCADLIAREVRLVLLGRP